MTKKEMFTALMAMAEVQANEEIFEGVKHELELVSRPRKKSDKPTAKQIANDDVKVKIAEVLVNAEEPMTAKAIGDTLKLTSQKVSALLRQMDGIKREVVKGKALFSLA